jgi:NADH dehydrogenase (ubiquinone) 1 beta subcomplex subunit 9
MNTSGLAAAGLGAAHRRHVCHLYKRSLKLQLDWIVKRDLWYPEANKTRALFRQHMNEKDPRTISRLVKDTEHLLHKYRHPDPYVGMRPSPPNC